MAQTLDFPFPAARQMPISYLMTVLCPLRLSRRRKRERDFFLLVLYTHAAPMELGSRATRDRPSTASRTGGGGLCGYLARIEQQTYEPFGLWGENSAFAQHHAVFAICKEFASGDHFQLFLSCDAYTHDDGNAQIEFDVFFDHFPAADFHGDLIRESMLFEGAVD